MQGHLRDGRTYVLNVCATIDCLPARRCQGLQLLRMIQRSSEHLTSLGRTVGTRMPRPCNYDVFSDSVWFQNRLFRHGRVGYTPRTVTTPLIIFVFHRPSLTYR